MTLLKAIKTMMKMIIKWKFIRGNGTLRLRRGSVGTQPEELTMKRPRALDMALDLARLPAFAPASTRTVPELEIDLTGEPEMVAVPHAAVRSAAATRSARSLFIAIRITQGVTVADGLDAA